MKKTVKQVVGIDVAQKELVVCIGKMYDDCSSELIAHKDFSNNFKGFQALQAWVKKFNEPAIGLRFVMEATGVYHEKLAYYLAAKTVAISIVLPNKISNYSRTLTTKTVTDKTASRAIAQFGLEKQLDDWQPPRPIFRRLRQLTRERDQLITERTMLKNQLHAERAQQDPSAESINRMKKRVALLDKQVLEIESEITALVKSDQQLKTRVKNICTMPGVAQQTAVTVLAETNGFELIRNKRQLTSYAGLDVKEKQSGTSVRGKSRISKRGNKYLRKALYMPALSLLRCNDHYKSMYTRLVARHGINMKGAVAIQRKMLEMIYILDKTGKAYDPEYHPKKLESSINATL